MITPMRHLVLLALVFSVAACKGKPDEDPHAHHGDTALPLPAISDDARVFFVSPSDGAVVTGPLVDGKVEVKFEMGAKGVAVEPVEKGTAVPTDEQHVHFGKAQTEAVIPLAPGVRRLTLQFADGAHRSYGPEVISSISITVEAEQAPEDEAPEDEAPEDEAPEGEAPAEEPS